MTMQFLKLPNDNAFEHLAWLEVRKRVAADEVAVRECLGRWVSEIPPALAYRNGEFLGLSPADTPIGANAFILPRAE